MTRRLLTVLASGSLILLGGCDYFSTPAGEAQSGNASGEVLEPSVSDSMIPTDDLTSQPPALREDPASGSPAEGAGDPDDAASGDDSDAPPADSAPAEDAEPAAE